MRRHDRGHRLLLGLQRLRPAWRRDTDCALAPWARRGRRALRHCGRRPLPYLRDHARGRRLLLGANNSGELGDGTTTSQSSPVAVAGGVRLAAVSGGYNHTCGITPAGAAYCWGYDLYGQLGDGQPGAEDETRSAPGLVAGGVSFAAVSAAFDHTCGVTAAGTGYCWGNNGSGQLGDGTTTHRSTPVLVAGGVRFAEVSASVPCGLSTAGDVYCWGQHESGALGDGTTIRRSTPGPVAGGVSFTALSAGARHACALTEVGSAYCWGDNREGQLGDGTNTSRSSPILVAGAMRFAAVSAGSNHTCGVTLAGDVYCWGDNRDGQLGDGTTIDQLTPVRVVQ